MCGIFGLVSTKSSSLTSKEYSEIMNRLFILSESRGKEASGFSFELDSSINVHKTPSCASELLKTNIYQESLRKLSKQEKRAGIGHSRLVTDGEEYDNSNNQPVVRDQFLVVHNGIIVNASELWQNYPGKERKTDLDSEIIPVIFSSGFKDNCFESATKTLFDQIQGMTSICIQFNHFRNLLLATNNGSLYFVLSHDKSSMFFCSERNIATNLMNSLDFGKFSINNVKHLKSNTALFLDLDTLGCKIFDFRKNNTDKNYYSLSKPRENPKPIFEKDISKNNLNSSSQKSYTRFSIQKLPPSFISHFEESNERISKIKRCKKCVLPSTFPFVKYDENGICNYCNNHKVFARKSYDALLNKVEKVKREKTGDYNCLIPLSGGRDSSYTLHYVSQELGLKPLAFSYDWGMITDLARRNQSRLCGKLGIEHILISADIRKKRDNIRKNVSAWLKNPHLGLVPIFMAGDKQYHYFSNLLLMENNLNLSIMGDNPLEVTNFKSGFCGIPPKYGSLKDISISDKIRMLLLYGKEYLINPAYLNSSLLDTLDAFNSYYVIKHKNINIFDYLPWDEEIINKTLESYQWEVATDTKSTWRIGDGTASFYNYIYYIVAGFDENDTFRSNQIREGQITRHEAKELLINEHYPRWESMQWYCETIGLDFIKSLNRINKIRKFYD